MDTHMHKTMASVVSLGKIKIIRSQEFMPSEVRLKFLKKMIILRPKTAILGPQFCRILVLGPHFWWSGGGPDPQSPPGSAPGTDNVSIDLLNVIRVDGCRGVHLTIFKETLSYSPRLDTFQTIVNVCSRTVMRQ